MNNLKRCLYSFMCACLLTQAHSAATTLSGRVPTEETGATSAVKMDENIEVVLNLEAIKAAKLTEKGGDEIYFDVLAFGKGFHPAHRQVPPYPHHWPDFVLDKVKNVTLWKGHVKKKAEVKLIVSLLEKDVPPWNTNDLLGTFEITLQQDKRHLVISYSEPGNPKTFKKAFDKLSQEVSFTLGAGEYHFTISVQGQI